MGRVTMGNPETLRMAGLSMTLGRRVRDTQLDSWVVTQKDLSKRRREVLEVLEANPGGLATIQICEALQRPMHAVSGRITELCDLGLVEDSGGRVHNQATDRNVIVWIRTPRMPLVK